MKILNLYFKNINSLEGENRIDFDKAPLADTGVFAITGPNGSGKTSILDAITLGLYGETFKFDRPSAHVMTKHTAECFSQVIFSLGERKFCSTWSVRRAQGNKNGELLPPKMQLTEINGSEAVLGDQPNLVRNKITELIGMDFRGFTRSIMLAQGDFTAFLNALDNERLDILEKIISSDIYTDFKNELLEKAQRETNKLREIEKKITAFSVMDEQEISASELDLADFKEQYLDLKDGKNNLNQQLDWLKNIQAIEDRVVALQKAAQQAELRKNNTRTDLQRIEENQDALVYQPDIQALENMEEEIKRQQQNLETLRGESGQLQNRLQSLGIDAPDTLSESARTTDEQKQAIEKLRAQAQRLTADKQSVTARLQAQEIQLAEKKAALEEIQKWLQEHKSEHFLMDDFPEIGKLKKLRNELQSLQQKQKYFAKWSKTTTSSISKNKAEIEKLSRKISRLKLSRQHYENEYEEIVQGKTPEEIAEILSEQRERIVLFKDLISLARSCKKIDTGSGLGAMLFSKPQSDSDKLKQQLAGLENEILKENNILRTLERAVAHETLLRKHQVERVLLVEGEPCPLCGALQHPYVNKPPRLENSSQALADQKTKLRDLQTGSDKLRQEIVAAEQQEQKNRIKETQIQQIRSQWQTTITRLNAARDDLDISNIRLMKKMLKDEKTDLESIIALQKNSRRQQNRINKTGKLIENCENKLNQLINNTGKLDKDWNERPQELIDLDKNITERELQLQTLSDRIIEQLAGLDLKLPKKGKEDVFYDQLNQRRQDYMTHHMRDRELRSGLDKWSHTVAEARTEADDLARKLEQCASQLQTEEITGLHLALIEKQKLIASEEKLNMSLQTEKNKHQQVLQEKISGSTYKSISELREMLSLIHRQNELHQMLTTLQQEIEKLSVDQQKARDQLDAESAVKMTELTQQEIEIQLRQMTEKMEITKFEISRLEKTLREQKTLIVEQQKLVEQLEGQQKICNEYNHEVQQMSVEKGSAFRRRVQKRMAEKLLANANNYLEKISGRYYLYRDDKRQGLALEIEDTFKNNSRRQPKTLSGGESFVVSLALALALSEMANNGNAVDSLFLDEGFGNLDEEALYLVVSTLKTLHNHGKTVGVISHIKGVKERINTQIEMIKNPNGSSGLSIVS